VKVGDRVRVDKLTTDTVRSVRRLEGKEGTVSRRDGDMWLADFGFDKRLMYPDELTLIEEVAP
jgi:hypothetical protein